MFYLDTDTYKVVPNDESYIFTPEFHTVQIPNATFYTNRNFYAVSYNPPCAGVGNDRLIDNNDGTVTDVCTGLIWIQDASCYVFGVEATWEIANVVASTISSGECGLSDNSIEGDWRLPGFHEWWRLGEDPPDYETNFYTHPWEVDQSLIHIERAVKYHIGYDKKWTFEHYNGSHQTTSEDNAILRKSWLVRDPN